jgi:hypothetical protein
MAPLKNLANFEFHLFFLGGDGGIMTLGLAPILESTMANRLFNIVVATSNPHAFGPSLGKTIIDIEINEIGFEISIVQPFKKKKAKCQVQRNF